MEQDVTSDLWRTTQSTTTIARAVTLLKIDGRW